MTYLEPTTTYPTGSIDGVTYHRRGPLRVARQRVYPKKVPRAWDPTDPRAGGISTTTPTNAISQLSIAWELLTDAQRIGWGQYAFATPLTDAWGHPRTIKGYAHYMRSNRPRLMFGLPLIDDAPTTPGLPDFLQPTGFLFPDASALSLEILEVGGWTDDSANNMLVWIGHATSPGVTRPIETYAPLGAINPDDWSLPGIVPLTLPNPPPPTTFNAWFRCAVTFADGRYAS